MHLGIMRQKEGRDQETGKKETNLSQKRNT